MQTKFPTDQSGLYVVIRHLRDRGAYAVEYGDSATELLAGPQFSSLDRAIDWVERLDSASSAGSGGKVGDD